MIIGIPIYQKVDLLDVAAPAEIFDSMKAFAPQLDVEIFLIAEDCGDVVTRSGVILKPQKSFEEVPTLDVLWVPGGDPSALDALMHDPVGPISSSSSRAPRMHATCRPFVKARCCSRRRDSSTAISPRRIGRSSPA